MEVRNDSRADRTPSAITAPRKSWPCHPGTAKGILTILAEDDDHLADFQEYME